MSMVKAQYTIIPFFKEGEIMANNEDNFEEMYSSSPEEEQQSRSTKKQVGKALAGKVKDVGSTAIKFGGTGIKRVILLALPYIAVGVIIIIAILALISVLVFMFSAPDMLRGQIVQMADEFWTQMKSALVGAWKGDDYAAVTEQHVIDVAKYIDLMGYDLVGYGFVDTENGDEIEKNENGEITKVSSDIITEYLAAENRTYMLSSVSISSLFRWWKGVDIFPTNTVTDTIMQTEEDKNDGAENSGFGTGMINISRKIDAVPEIEIDGQKVTWDELANSESEGTGGQGKSVKVEITPEIDRETRKLTLTIKETKLLSDGQKKQTETKCIYNLDGWTGRYGKPIEFLLALHIGTMAPGFSEAVATRAEFDTKVNIRLHKSVEVVRLKYKGMTLDETKEALDQRVNQLWDWMRQVNAAQKKTVYVHQNAVDQAQRDLGITYDEIDEGKKYEQENTKEKYTPYIVNVENHWYKDIVYKKDLDKASEDDAYVETYPTTKKSRYNKFDVSTYISGEIYQVKEPKRSEVNKEFERLFSEATWEKVNGDTGFVRSDLLFTNTTSKITLGNDMQNALVMLEKAAQKSDDAKYIVRDLKEWLTTKGLKFKDSHILTNKVTDDDETTSGSSTGNSSNNGNESSSSGSTTSSSSGFKNLLGGKTAQILYNGNDAIIKTSEIANRTGVKSIVSGTVMQISDDTIQIKINSPSNIKDNILIMTGVKMDTAIKVGDTLNKNTPIAETILGKDMTIKMQDESRNSISVKDNLSK